MAISNEYYDYYSVVHVLWIDVGHGFIKVWTITFFVCSVLAYGVLSWLGFLGLTSHAVRSCTWPSLITTRMVKRHHINPIIVTLTWILCLVAYQIIPGLAKFHHVVIIFDVLIQKVLKVAWIVFRVLWNFIVGLFMVTSGRGRPVGLLVATFPGKFRHASFIIGVLNH